MSMKKAILYFHGKGGSASEAEHYRPLAPGYDVFGADYHASTPWEAADEFPELWNSFASGYNHAVLVGNSIGAYFAMTALSGGSVIKKPDQALFISPVVDMELLIRDMMGWAGVSESELKEKREIPTVFGETLSWEYLLWVREHPLRWNGIPTAILYAGKDNLTSRRTVSEFAFRTSSGLTVMEDGEHWFHTEEQMAFLDRWFRENLQK